MDHRHRSSPLPHTNPRTSSCSSSLSSPSTQVPLLLQHLHRSIFQIDRLYAQQVKRRPLNDEGGRFSEEVMRRSALVGGALPPDPATPEEGEEILEFFCRELGMGSKPLRMWREGVHRRMHRKWVYRKEEEDTCRSSLPSPLFLEHVARRVPLEVWEQARQAEHNRKKPKKEDFLRGSPSGVHKDSRKAPHEGKEPAEGRRDQLFFYPRPQDTAFVRSCMKHLKAVISPFLTLSPPPRTIARRRCLASSRDTPESHSTPVCHSGTTTTNPSPDGRSYTTPFEDETKEDYRPYSYDSCSTFYATQFIPAGMCLMSIPTAAGFFLNPTLSSLPSTTPWSTSSSFSPTLDEGVEVGSSDTTTLASLNVHHEGKGVSCETARERVSRRVDEVDSYLLYFQQLDDLVGQMISAADPPANDSAPSSVEAGEGSRKEEQEEKENLAGASSASVLSSPHSSPSTTTMVSPLSGYLSYLKESVVPCKNLPFIRTKEELWEVLHPYALEDEKEEKHVSPQDSTEGNDDGNEKRRKKSIALGATSTIERSSLSSHSSSSLGSRSPSNSLSPFRSAEATIQDEKKRQAFQNSAAYALWCFFHEEMKGTPLSPSLREYFQLPPSPLTTTTPSYSTSSSSTSRTLSVYHWWLSVVLSRRLGASCLMPLVDKLNHSPLPNCYYTMAAPVPVEESDSSSSSSSTSSLELLQSMTGLDVFHNLVAGVPSLYLYEPYFHVFALRDIHPGEAVTLCYQAPSHHLYRPAHTLSVSSALSEDHEDMTTTTAALLARASALRLRHPGKSSVDTLEGQGSWQLQWGFAPSEDAFFSAQDLMEMGALLTEKRVEERKQLFSLSS